MGAQLGDPVRTHHGWDDDAAAGWGEVSPLGMGTDLRNVWRLESTGFTDGLGGANGKSHQENRWI